MLKAPEEVKKEEKRETMRQRPERREMRRRAAGSTGLAAQRLLVAFEDHVGHDTQLEELRRRFKKVTDDVELNLPANERGRLNHLMQLLTQGQKKLMQCVEPTLKAVSRPFAMVFTWVFTLFFTWFLHVFTWFSPHSPD